MVINDLAEASACRTPVRASSGRFHPPDPCPAAPGGVPARADASALIRQKTLPVHDDMEMPGRQHRCHEDGIPPNQPGQHQARTARPAIVPAPASTAGDRRLIRRLAVDTCPGLRRRVRHAPASLRVPRRAGDRDRGRRQHSLLRRALRHRRPDRARPPAHARRDYRRWHVPGWHPAHAAVPHPSVPASGAARPCGDRVRTPGTGLDPPTVLRHQLPQLAHDGHARRGDHRHHQRRARRSQLTAGSAPEASRQSIRKPRMARGPGQHDPK